MKKGTSAASFSWGFSWTTVEGGFKLFPMGGPGLLGTDLNPCLLKCAWWVTWLMAYVDLGTTQNPLKQNLWDWGPSIFIFPSSPGGSCTHDILRCSCPTIYWTVSGRGQLLRTSPDLSASFHVKGEGIPREHPSWEAQADEKHPN